MASTDVNQRITVEDIRKLALPLGTRVIAGDGLLHQPVSWATVIYPQDTIEAKTLQENEVVLLANKENSRLGKATIIDVIRWAADHKAAAVVLSENASSTAIAEAKAYSVPLLALPPNSQIRLVEKQIISLLIDRKVQIERRGTQIYRQLTQISSRNEGISELINTMARLTGKSVVIQDKRLKVVYSSVQPHFVSHWDDVEHFLKRSDNIPVEFQDRRRVTLADTSIVLQALSEPRLARLIAPVVTNEIGRGFLSIIGFDNELDDIDSLVVEYGAQACALEMAKQKSDQ